MTSADIPSLLSALIADARARRPDRAALIGIGGAQGSGKSFQCKRYAATRPRVAHFSLDDVYLTHAERTEWATLTGNPLFATRGPPGTHDLGLATGLIARLRAGAPTPMPRFDKKTDDRAPEADWLTYQGPAEAILIDGWCMGALAPADSQPINAVEHEDVEGRWRHSIWLALENAYASFFERFDALIYLQAPSWEIVRVWRGQQEEETLGRSLTREENVALDRFVMHYERVTRAMLAGHHRAGWIVHLDEQRNVTRIEER